MKIKSIEVNFNEKECEIFKGILPPSGVGKLPLGEVTTFLDELTEALEGEKTAPKSSVTAMIKEPHLGIITVWLDDYSDNGGVIRFAYIDEDKIESELAGSAIYVLSA